MAAAAPAPPSNPIIRGVQPLRVGEDIIRQGNWLHLNNLMDPIDYIYVALAVVFALVMVYMFTYNLKMRRREDALKNSRSQHVGKQEAIVMTSKLH